METIRTKIENSFEELGVDYEHSIIDKCVELCIEHRIEDADELVDSWMAFSVSNLQGGNPTAQHLARFEREVFAKKEKKNENEEVDSFLRITSQDASDILSAYNQTPRRNQRTPECNTKGPRFGSFSPVSFSPIINTPSAKYKSRKNAGSILCERTTTKKTLLWEEAATVKILGPKMSTQFMAFHLNDNADAVEAHMTALVEQLTKRFSLDEFTPVHMKHSTSTVVAGRVVCDADGKLNSESLLLEASPGSGGEVVKLDLSSISAYSVFPGQVLAVEGLNVTGERMNAQSIWCDASISLPPPAVLLPGDLKVIIACGPFTPTDSLTYEPLMDLMQVVVREEPHLLLLTGPLLDADHPAIADGLIAELFEEMFDHLLDLIMKPLAGLQTEVVLVSSHRESQGCAVFPTPPLTSVPHPKLSYLPDPCILDLNGILIAATTVDVLMHLGKEEVAFPPHTGDRLARLAGHVLQQQTFYPLRPPALGLPLDPSLERHLDLTIVPHLLVLPSDLRCFIKDVNGCTVVNPEHLSKGVVGGTFAKLIIESNGQINGQVIKV